MRGETPSMGVWRKNPAEQNDKGLTDKQAWGQLEECYVLKARVRASERKKRSTVWDCREIRVGKNSRKAFEFSKRKVPNLCVQLQRQRTPLTKQDGYLRAVTPSSKHRLEMRGSRIPTVMNHSYFGSIQEQSLLLILSSYAYS